MEKRNGFGPTPGDSPMPTNAYNLVSAEWWSIALAVETLSNETNSDKCVKMLVDFTS